MAHLEILLVDDDPLVRHVIADELEEAGHFVTPAVGPEAALELLTEHDGYDLVLIDYTMPGMSGTALARTILTRNPEARLAILTGRVELPEPAPCPVLTKGVRMSELIRAIEALASGETPRLPHDASASRVELLVDQIATRPAVGGVERAIGQTFDIPADGSEAFASLLDQLPEK